MYIVTYVLLMGLYLTSALYMVAIVGKPRETVTPTSAAWSVAIAIAIAGTITYLYSGFR